MIVVSDTSALSNLIQVQQLPILAALFKQIIIPQEVYKELCEIATQKQLIDNQNWILVQPATNQTKITELKQNLDDGEAEAIALALEINSDYLLIDELKGRNIAENHGIKIVGLLGILIKAKQQGILTAIKPIMEQLLTIGFRIKPTLFDRVLEEVSNTIKIKYEFTTVLFVQKTQKKASLLRGLKQGILTPKGWNDYRK